MIFTAYYYRVWLFVGASIRPIEQDLMMTVGSDLTSEDVRIALKQFDPSGDGKVTFE